MKFTPAQFIDLYPHEVKCDIENYMRGLGDNISTWCDHNSAARKAMLATHIGQTLVINGSTPKYVSTGGEREMGKYIFNIKMPEDGTILEIIERYPRTHEFGSIKHTPEIYVIYEVYNSPTKETKSISIPKFSLNDTKFGFDYVLTEALHSLAVGKNIAKGTVLATSPNIDNLGNYNIGLEVNVCYMSDVGGAEDGYIVSDRLLERIIPTVYGKRVIEFGAKKFPLEMYPKVRPTDGTTYMYGFMPDIGDMIREDGIIAALREYNPMFAAFESTAQDLRTPTPFDELIHGQPGAEIIDIVVYAGKCKVKYTDPGMGEQAEKYLQRGLDFHVALIEAYENLQRINGKEWIGEPCLTSDVVEAYSRIPGQKANPTHKLKPIDEYRIEITYRYSPKPTIGAKATDFGGGKGVICEVRKWQDMPCDELGNYADLVRGGDAIGARLIIGKLYEHFTNAASRDVALRVTTMCDAGNWTEAWDYLCGFYLIIAPDMFEGGLDQLTDADIKNHLDDIIQGYKESRKALYLRIPNNTKGLGLPATRKLLAQYAPHFGPVKYRGKAGNMVTTLEPVEIGSEYMILLEKLADDYAGVAIAKVQSHGLPAPLSNADKHSSLVRKQPGRIIGETEQRNLVANVGDVIAAELNDISTNPKSTRAVARALLTAEKVGDVGRLINRDEIALGGSRAVRHVSHVQECGGMQYGYIDTDTFGREVDDENV